MLIIKPHPSELNEYYRSYLPMVPENDMLSALEAISNQTAEFLKSISDETSMHAYQPGKWIIKEVVGHLSDAERILSYRALCFARKDNTPLPGFEENDYVINSNFKSRSWTSICQEKKVVSEATKVLFQSLDESAFDLTGTANGNKVSVRSLLFFILSHERHHLQVIKDRYLRNSQ